MVVNVAILITDYCPCIYLQGSGNGPNCVTTLSIATQEPKFSAVSFTETRFRHGGKYI